MSALRNAIFSALVVSLSFVGGCAPQQRTDGDKAVSVQDITPEFRQKLSHDRDPIRATIAGYAPRGIGSLLGEGQAAAIRKSFPGSNIIYEPGNPAGGIALLSKGKRKFALAGTLEMYVAREGNPPFDKPYGDNVFAVTALAPNSAKTHVYARAAFLDRHNITSLADIRDKKIPVRLGINQPGNIWVRAMVAAIMDEYQMSLDNIEEWGGTLSEDVIGGAHDLMKDKRLDVIISGSYAPDGRIIELNTSTPVRFVPFSADEGESIASRLSLDVTLIEKGTYEFQEQDLIVPVTSHMIVAGPAASFEEVYKVTKALVENFDDYRASHPALRSLKLNDVVPRGPGVVIHPAASLYYQEAGLLVQ